MPPLLTLVLCLAGIRRPVLWTDELATWSAVDRSVPEILRFTLHTQDAVQGLYYVLLHGWSEVVGLSPVRLRLPSAAAMAGAAGLVTMIGNRLFGPRAGLVAGLLFAILPATTMYGQEGRPYAFVVLAAAASTLLLVDLLERARFLLPGGWRWPAYAAATALIGWLQLTSLLVLAAHLVAAAAYVWHWQDRRFAVRWLLAAGAAVGSVLPLAHVASGQAGQVAWIGPVTWRQVVRLPTEVFAAPTVAGLVVGVALLAAVRAGRGEVLALGLAVLPFLGLLLASAHTSFLVPRYLMVTLLGWVLLAAAGLARAGWRETALVLVVVLFLGLPTHYQLRQTGRTHPHDTDLRALAAVVGDHLAPGDAFVVPADRGWRLRVALQAYLPAERRPQDVLLTGGTDVTHTFDLAQCDPAVCLGTPPRIWAFCLETCSDPVTTGPQLGLDRHLVDVMEQKGYRPGPTWPIAHGKVALYVLPAGGVATG